MPKYYDFRCKHDNKLLGRVAGDAEIVCSRCGYINELDFGTKLIKCYPKDKKPIQKPNPNATKEHIEQLRRIEKRTSSGVRFDLK